MRARSKVLIEGLQAASWNITN